MVGARISAPASANRSVDGGGIVNLESHAQSRRNPAANFNFVDHLDLGGVGEFESGSTGLEDDDVLAAGSLQIQFDRQP